MILKWNKATAALWVAGLVIAVSGCGTDTDTVTGTQTGDNTIAKTATAPSTVSVIGSNSVDSGPIMPNVDESQMESVTLAAVAAYEREWGDGSGVNVVWGPNIISGWALLGLENQSGAAEKDVLLAQDNGVWQVRDMGNSLAERWENQTPPGLLPSM